MYLRLTDLDICMYAKGVTVTEQKQNRRQIEHKSELKCNCNWLTPSSNYRNYTNNSIYKIHLYIEKSVRFQAVKQTLVVHFFFLYCCHSQRKWQRKPKRKRKRKPGCPQHAALFCVCQSLFVLCFLSLSLTLTLSIGRCNLVTLCFIFITHTKLLHIKKVKFSFLPPPPTVVVALIAPRLSFHHSYMKWVWFN